MIDVKALVESCDNIGVWIQSTDRFKMDVICNSNTAVGVDIDGASNHGEGYAICKSNGSGVVVESGCYHIMVDAICSNGTGNGVDIHQPVSGVMHDIKVKAICTTNNGQGIRVFADNAGAIIRDVTIDSPICMENSQSPVTTHSGVLLTVDNAGALDSISVKGGRCGDRQGVQTQKYGVYIYGTGTITDVTVDGVDVTDNVTAGVLSALSIQTLRVTNCPGYNPIGKVTNAFDTTNDDIELYGDAAVPDASTVYVVRNADVIISSTDSGNTDNAILIKDNLGNQINPVALSTLDAYYLPIGYQIDWGAFTGAAPTVVVCFI